MFSIEFALDPVAEISPWPVGGPHLTWFSLTPGHYSIRVDDVRNAIDNDGSASTSYEVARLFEDLMDVVVAVADEGATAYLYLGYLEVRPELRFQRRDAETVTFSRAPSGDGVHRAKEVELDAVDFLNDVVQFGRSLLHAMRIRCADIQRRGGLEGIRIDLRRLAAEQRRHEREFEMTTTMFARTLLDVGDGF